MKTLLLSVKPFQETLNASMCGPASLKMVFDYYGIEKTEEELAKLCNVNKELGTDDKTMKKVAESFGFKVEIKNFSSFEDIEKWLKKGVPVIVDWFSPGRMDKEESEMPDGHSSIVVGLDLEYIYLQDPETGGLRKLKREDFYRVWFDFRKNHITNWEEMVIRQIIAIYKSSTKKV